MEERRPLLNESLISKHNGIIDIAIKIFTNPKLRENPADFYYEVALISSIPKSPHVVEFIGYSDKNRKRLCIVMKFYKSSLTKLIQQSNFPFSPALILKICREVALGLQVIHNTNIVHLDLKPSKRVVLLLLFQHLKF